MKNNQHSRRGFLKNVTYGGIGMGIGASFLSKKSLASNYNFDFPPGKTGKRIGIIGLDTSHSEVFTRMINNGEVSGGYKVVAAYPHGSPDIPSALAMKPDIMKAVQEMGVKIVASIDELLDQVDVVLLESNDGRPHYEQGLKVIKKGKPLFIDKPISNDLNGCKKIFEVSRKYNVPVFSSSALRFEKNIQKAVSGEFGRVLGADVYTPAEVDINHIDMAWYGIHGVEMLFTLLGTGCEKVFRVHEADVDVITGVWKGGRIGTVRGIRKGAANIAGTAFCENAILPVGPFETYLPLVEQIIRFFETGVPPVSPEETIEIFAFMDAADKSKRTGKYVKIS